MRSDIADIADSLLFVRVAVQFSVLASVRRVRGVSFFDGVQERPFAFRKVGTILFLVIYCYWLLDANYRLQILEFDCTTNDRSDCSID